MWWTSVQTWVVFVLKDNKLKDVLALDMRTLLCGSGELSLKDNGRPRTSKPFSLDGTGRVRMYGPVLGPALLLRSGASRRQPRGHSRDPPRLLQPRRWTVKPGRGSDAIPELLVPRGVLVAPVMPVAVPTCGEGSSRCPGEERGPGAGEAVPGAPGRSRAACAEADAAACPVTGDSVVCAPPETCEDGTAPAPYGFRSGSWTAAVRFWLQLLCGSCLFLLWFQSSRWTAPAPAHCGSSSWVALARFCSCSFWLQLICTFSFGSSSFAAPVCGCSGFSPAHGRLQLDSSSLRLQLMDGSGSFQLLLVVTPAHLHLQVQLLVGSSWVSSPGQFWLQPIDGSSSFSPPALGWFQLWLQPQPITACACSTAPGFWPGRKSIAVMACI
ncbi:uncharacterized protein LOC134516203 [Chroicocephalus ridibundus]|uniref:uncharacterized protein LOC134516203 n=1 Tax=Chroicocephalus ridibundus TaxID=1192867 RepID=UPI002FDE4E7E